MTSPNPDAGHSQCADVVETFVEAAHHSGVAGGVERVVGSAAGGRVDRRGESIAATGESVAVAP